MRIIVTFLLNAGLNFAVGLVVAALLGPAGYGHYAVLASTGALLATALFEWLRLSTARFYGEAQQRSSPALRASLDMAYAGLGAVLVGGAVLALGLPGRLGLTPTLVGAVVLTAVAAGVFDFRTALARARFRDRDYAVLVIGKGVLGLGCAAGAALVTHDPIVVLAAQAAGTLLCTLPVRRALADRSEIRGELALVRRFAIYGLPVVAANVVFQSILLLNRGVAAARFGFDAAGHLSLATDVELRIFLAVGAALDVLLFQLAVRSEAAGGAQAAARQVRTNMVLVAAILLLLAVGFVAMLPVFTALVVPARFQDGFAPLALAMVPGIVLFCFGQFAINPVFQMAHRTLPIIGGALASAGLDGLGLVLVPVASGPIGIALVHAFSLGFGVVCLTAAGLRDPAVRPSSHDCTGLVVAAALTLAALWPLRGLAPSLLALGLSAVVGPCVFVAVLMAFDTGDARRHARWLWSLARRHGRRHRLA